MIKLKNHVLQIAREFIRRCNEKFPGIFLDYYMCGSQLDNSANCNSDIDLILVAEFDVALEVRENLNQLMEEINKTLHPPIGATVFSFNSLDTLPGFAKNALHLSGIDCFRSIPLQSIDLTIQQYILGSLKFINKFLRGSSVALSYPLLLPDPQTEMAGYIFPEEAYGKSSKRLISAIARFCGALIAIKWDRQPVSKRCSIQTYSALTKCNFKYWVLETYDLLAQTWEYKIPQTGIDREKFKTILITFNEFENFFLESISPYIRMARDRGGQQRWLEECQNLIVLESIRDGSA